VRALARSKHFFPIGNTLTDDFCSRVRVLLDEFECACRFVAYCGAEEFSRGVVERRPSLASAFHPFLPSGFDPFLPLALPHDLLY
jgi:hypothetical protein